MAFKTNIIELKKENFFNNRNNIGFMFWTLIIIMLLLQYIFDGIGTISSFVVLACLIGILILRILKLGKDNVKFKIIGELHITKSTINVNQQSYNLTELKVVKIEIHNFENEKEFRGTNNFRGVYSVGIDNFLKFETSENEKFTFQFKLANNEHHLNLRPFILNAIKFEKMNLKDGYEALGLKNYADIQDFKNELSELQ